MATLLQWTKCQRSSTLLLTGDSCLGRLHHRDLCDGKARPTRRTFGNAGHPGVWPVLILAVGEPMPETVKAAARRAAAPRATATVRSYQHIWLLKHAYET